MYVWNVLCIMVFLTLFIHGMFLYIYIYIYIYVCVFLYMCVFQYLCAFQYMCAFLYMCAYIIPIDDVYFWGWGVGKQTDFKYAWMICLHVCMIVCLNVWMYVCMCVCMYVCMHVCVVNLIQHRCRITFVGKQYISEKDSLRSGGFTF